MQGFSASVMVEGPALFSRLGAVPQMKAEEKPI